MASSDNQDASYVGNLAQFQINHMRRYGDSIALVDVKTNKQYTYAVVIDRIHQLAAGLRSLGLRQGDVLCALTFNTVEYPIIWYAVVLLGATFQTASPLYTDEELERRFVECNTKFLVTMPDQSNRITKMIHSMKQRSVSFSSPNILNKVIVIGDAGGSIPYESLFSNGRVTEPVDCDPRTTTAILLSSSGTTGLPKFVRLSHVNIISNTMQMRHNLPIQPGYCTIVALPVFHHFGVHGALCTNLNSGVKLIVMERFDVPQFLSLIQTHKANFLQIVPTMAARIVKFTDRYKYDISSVTFIQTAAASLGVELDKQLRNVFNLSFIGQGYGLTETGFNAGNMVDKYKPGSSGVVPDGVHVKIVDHESGKLLPSNTRGEILVGGPQITIGYLNNPEASKMSIDKDGYFKTGDVGYFDEDGFLFIVDRIKELIKYQGMQVAPAYLEDILVKHRAIADAGVVGIPDADAGELPKAYVVLQPGEQITEKEVIKYVAEHVSPHMRLRGGVEFISQIPRNPSGKILRRFLRDKNKKSKL